MGGADEGGKIVDPPIVTSALSYNWSVARARAALVTVASVALAGAAVGCPSLSDLSGGGRDAGIEASALESGAEARSDVAIDRSASDVVVTDNAIVEATVSDGKPLGCQGTPTSCGLGNGCIDCTSAPQGHACIGDAFCGCTSAADCAGASDGNRCTSSQQCGCSGASDCPPLEACSATTGRCSSECTASINGCNGGCCDPSSNSCIDGCDGGCCSAGTIPTCVAGRANNACGSGGGACVNCERCGASGLGKVCVWLAGGTGMFDGGGSVCGCNSLTDCCMTIAVCQANVCN